MWWLSQLRRNKLSLGGLVNFPGFPDEFVCQHGIFKTLSFLPHKDISTLRCDGYSYLLRCSGDLFSTLCEMSGQPADTKHILSPTLETLTKEDTILNVQQVTQVWGFILERNMNAL